MKTIFLRMTFFLMFMPSMLTGWSHDFEVGGIYYNITNSSTKEVCVTYAGMEPESYDGEYSAFINIPSTVTLASTTYSVTSIGEYAFFECHSLLHVTIPNSVTYIDDCAFLYCTNLFRVNIPNSITSFGQYAFGSCKSLTSICIPESVISIKNNAFDDCSGLKSITLPKSVTEIGYWAFYGCSGLTSITVNNLPSNISLGSEVFYYGVPKNTCILYVPVGSKGLYEVASQWKDFQNISDTRLITDGEAYTNVGNTDDINIEYTRTFAPGMWQPLYVPFNMSYEEWKDYASVAELACVHTYEDGRSIIEFVTLTSGEILPNIPYVIMPKVGGEITFSCTNKKLLAAPNEGENYISCSSPRYIFKLFGNYQPIDASTLAGYGDPEYNGAYVMTSGNKFLHASDGTELKPYRFYITQEKNPNGYWNSPSRYNMPMANTEDDDVIYFMVDGQISGIFGVSADYRYDDRMYNLNGIEIQDPHNGVFIKNGKKVFIK